MRVSASSAEVMFQTSNGVGLNETPPHTIGQKTADLAGQPVHQTTPSSQMYVRLFKGCVPAGLVEVGQRT